MIHPKVASCLILLLIAGCSQLDGFTTPIPPSSSAPTWEMKTTPSIEPFQQPTSTQVKTMVSPTAPSATPVDRSEICSPLHGFQLAQLEEIISTPFDPPTPGSDGGHHGVDFGFYSYGPFSSMEDLPVQSILDGRVAAVIDDRPPYGNMVIIETKVSRLPEVWQAYLQALPEISGYQPDGRLACPTPESALKPGEELSLYVLYAHLAESAEIMVGDTISCGQQFNFVGNTGYSGNTHLHLEMRLGPAGVQFLHLAHYVNNASVEEMANYCVWRVSPLFRLLDPVELLTAN